MYFMFQLHDFVEVLLKNVAKLLLNVTVQIRNSEMPSLDEKPNSIKTKYMSTTLTYVQNIYLIDNLYIMCQYYNIISVYYIFKLCW
jgi:hypothetical protein